MTNAEIKNKAKKKSGGNYYYEQGFVYGFELGEENGRKEGYEQGKKNERKLQCGKKNYEKEKCELLGIIQGKDKVIAELKAQIEKTKCCFTCKYHQCIYEGNLKSTCKKLHHKADDCIINNYEYLELAE